MYILYKKQLYIPKEEMLKNRTAQSWRGVQIAMCEDEKPLQEIIDKATHKDNYYIEKQQW